MNTQTHQTISCIVALVWATMFFSCDGNLDQVRMLEEEITGPQSEAKNFNLFYTDSGQVKANIRGPQMLDFTHLNYPYREFPEGVEVDIFDDDSTKNTVVADFAMIFDEDELIDLRGNVVIVTSDSTVLKSDQLYYDQATNWMFTDYQYQIEMPNGAINKGEGFDANDNFDNFNSRTNIGKQYIDE